MVGAARAATPSRVPRVADLRPCYFGVCFTNELGRQGYGAAESDSALAELARLGANTVALVPYGMMRALDDTEIRFGGARTWESDESLIHAIRVAHRCGLRVILKPQVWVARGGFTGDVAPRGAAWAAWWASYNAFVAHFRDIAAREHAEAYCLGTELAGTTLSHPGEWRALVRETRHVYRGEITYSANWWGEFSGISFWDALDYIGVSFYFPIQGDDRAARLASARANVAQLDSVARRTGREVMVMEAGIPSRQGGSGEPWRETWAGIPDPQGQARSAEAIVQSLGEKPWLRGVLWWKWYNTVAPLGPLDVGYCPRGKPAQHVLQTFWQSQRGR